MDVKILYCIALQSADGDHQYHLRWCQMDVISFANLITIWDAVQVMNFDYHRKHQLIIIKFHFVPVNNTPEQNTAA